MFFREPGSFARISRQQFEKFDELSLVPSKIGRELPQNRPELVAQGKHSGSEEGVIAINYLGALAVNAGKLDEAEKRYKEVADSGNKALASLGKLSLAQLYFVQNRAKDGEALLRDLIAHRKNTGSFRGDVDEFVATVLGNVAQKKRTKNILETADGRTLGSCRAMRSIVSPPQRSHIE